MITENSHTHKLDSAAPFSKGSAWAGLEDAKTIQDHAAFFYKRNKGVVLLHGVATNDAGTTHCLCGEGSRCGAAGKHPLKNGWQNITWASVDDLLKEMSEYEQRNGSPPNYGNRNGLAYSILDIDNKKGKSGGAKFFGLTGEHPEEHRGLLVGTPNGGWHLYYPKVKTPLKADSVDGLDYCGYVVGPGSVTDNGMYTIDHVDHARFGCDARSHNRVIQKRKSADPMSR